MFSSNLESPRHTEALCIVRGQDCGDCNQEKLEIAPWVSLQLLRGWWRPRSFHGPHMHSHGVHQPGDHLQSKGTTHYLGLLTWKKEDIEAQFQSHNFCQVVWKKTVKVLITQFSSVAQSCPILCNPWTLAHQAPLVHGAFQESIQEWVATSFSRGSSQPRDLTLVSCIADSLLSDPAEKPDCLVWIKKIQADLAFTPRGKQAKKRPRSEVSLSQLSGVALVSLELGTCVREKAPGREHGNPL